MAYITLKFKNFPEKPDVWGFMLVLLACLIGSGLQPSRVAAAPEPGRHDPAYVSARAHLHYMQATKSWTESNWSEALDSLKLASVYDRDALRVRARTIQLEFGLGKRVSGTTLRRLLNRKPSDPLLLRLMGLHYWKLGRIQPAQRAFLRAAKAAAESDDSMLKAVILRDLSLMQALELSIDSAITTLQKHAAQDRYLSAWRWRLLSWSAHLSHPDCNFEVDGEHTCGIGTFGSGDTSKSHMGMTWIQSLDLGLEVLAWSKVCREKSTKYSCRRFEEALQRLAQPLVLADRKDEF